MSDPNPDPPRNEHFPGIKPGDKLYKLWAGEKQFEELIVEDVKNGGIVSKYFEGGESGFVRFCIPHINGYRQTKAEAIEYSRQRYYNYIKKLEERLSRCHGQLHILAQLEKEIDSNPKGDPR